MITPNFNIRTLGASKWAQYHIFKIREKLQTLNSKALRNLHVKDEFLKVSFVPLMEILTTFMYNNPRKWPPWRTRAKDWWIRHHYRAILWSTFMRVFCFSWVRNFIPTIIYWWKSNPTWSHNMEMCPNIIIQNCLLNW